MDTFLIKAVQLILAFAILVVIHEFGHFLFARMFGVKVEKFYIFFNPIRSLFKWKPRKHVGAISKVRYLSGEGKEEYEACKALEQAEAEYGEAYDLVKKLSKRGASEAGNDELSKAKARLAGAEAKLNRVVESKNVSDSAEYESSRKESRWKRFWGHTEYGVGWLPLGGYCKISGMIDESMDTRQMKHDPQPWEFRSKPAWQRLLIMIAGVLFNFLLAILIYAAIVYATGEKYVRFEDARLGMAYSPVARAAGFQDGDIPLTADGKPLDSPMTARVDMIQAQYVTVLRNGTDTVRVAIPENFIFRLDEEMKNGKCAFSFMTYRIPARVTQVMAGEGADKGGIKAGDEIIALDSVATPTLDKFLSTLENKPGQRITVSVLRQGKAGAPADTLRLPVELSDGSKMGIGLEVDPSAFYKSQEKRYGLLESVPRGVEKGSEQLSSYAKSMKLVFTKEGAKSVGGFGAIGSIFPEKWDWIAFWNIAAFLSVALAFMNILPIPALDGGHVLFLIYEMIFRRPPSQKFMEYAQMTGMALLILLLLYANGMDIVRLFK